jgi:RNA ligase (TIGR02306 family)
MRKLASVKKVRAIYPIENADRIELAQLDDWTCIVKKGEFAVNDFAIYFEIDSLLPEEPRYSFLEKSKKEYDGIIKYRIRTMKMKKVLSQGLALPLHMFPELYVYEEHQDVTEKLNITKYEQQEHTQSFHTGDPSGKFPSFIPKTDQERIQNLPSYYEIYKDHLWEETKKLDGSSLTAYKVIRQKPTKLWTRFIEFFTRPPIYHFGVCSRNLELKRTDNFKTTFNNNGKESEYNQSDFWKIAIEFELEKYLPIGFAVQGELIGPKIQANHEKVDHLDFYIFSIFDIDKQHYLFPEEHCYFFHKYFTGNPKIKYVPVVNSSIPIFRICTDLEQLQKRVTGESINPNTISEGRVYKSCTIRGLSFKCVSNEYLLKYE